VLYDEFPDVVGHIFFEHIYLQALIEPSRSDSQMVHRHYLPRAAVNRIMQVTYHQGHSCGVRKSLSKEERETDV
jgi:hypothetical protein